MLLVVNLLTESRKNDPRGRLWRLILISEVSERLALDEN